MNFEIRELRQKIKFKNRFLDFIANWTIVPVMGILLLVCLPFIILYNWLLNKNREEIKTEFESIFQSEKIIIKRKFIDDRELPDDLDYENADDYIFVYSSYPNLTLFENRYFDYNFHETELGIYLVSFNEVGKGMTLWFIDKSTLEFQKIKNLVSSIWEFKDENNQVILSTQTDKEEIKIEINQI